MLQIHPNARTTPAVRAEIARSTEPSGVLAKRYAVSAETVRKWRKRGISDCLDRSARPHHLPWKATDEERAVVCALRQSTNFALDWTVSPAITRLRLRSSSRVPKPAQAASSMSSKPISRQTARSFSARRSAPRIATSPCSPAGHAR